jgi:radical SAM superfamily enzyme YgiQ (UPF0313 family)
MTVQELNKKRIIILSDNTIRKSPGTSRYLGPYTLTTAFHDLNTEVIIIDFFTRIENFFDYIVNFLTKETVFVGISNTFLVPEFKRKTDITKDDPLIRSEVSEFSFTGFLNFELGEDLLNWTHKLKNIIKVNSPNAKLILGGSKTGFIWKSTLSPENKIIKFYENFDYIFIGKSEKAIIEIFKKELNGSYIPSDNIKIKKVNSISFVFNNYERECPPTKISSNQAILNGEALSIELSRGCAFNCKFCYFDKKGSNRKDLERIKNELIYNFDNFGTTCYSITDDCFNDSETKVIEMNSLFKSLPFEIEWVCYGRPDVAVKFPHTLELMIDSGCKGISWGLESFNLVAARAAGKGVNPEKIKTMLLDSYQKYKDTCFYQGTFISGLPYDTPESINDTVEWIINNRSLDFVSMGALILSEFNPELDKNFIDFADFVKNPQKYNFTKVSFDPYDWEHSTMNRTQAIESAKKAYQKFLNNGYNTHITGIWYYPHLRYLGYTFRDISDMSRNPLKKQEWGKILSQDENNYLKKYHSLLLRTYKNEKNYIFE